MRRPAIVLLCIPLAVAGCGKSGRRTSDTTPPAVAAAVFVGPGATPVAGDTLRLYFAETIALVGGALLTDTDLTLAAGGSLGSVTAAPALVDARTATVVLGAGVSLVPGTSTIALSANNDAVIDGAGNSGGTGTAVVLTKGDGDAPVITRLTASAVDPLLNGQGPAGGTLQVPTTGFTLDLTYSDSTSTVDQALNDVSANVVVRVDGQNVAAGTNLVPLLTTSAATTALASYLVPANMLFPAADITFTARVRDATGMVSPATTFVLRATNATDGLRPFETSVNSSQVWFLDTTRDLESYRLVPNGGTTYLVSTRDANGLPLPPNGRADLQDALFLIGVLGGDVGINGIVLDHLQAAIQVDLARYFGGANVTFTFTSPGTFPGSPSVAYGSFGFSQIAIAGAPTQPGVLGLALYDPNNDNQNNDSLTDFQSSRLGVFLITVLDNSNGLGGPSTTLFRQTYDPLRSEIPPGRPIGDNPDGLDGERLAGTVNDPRTTTINNAINRMARFIAVVVAHETGHSMGLVKNGAMPGGLYGGDAVNFPGSNSEHIRMPTSLFPAGSVNIMSPSLNFELTQHGSTGFNSINLAYLRERALYNR